MKKLLFFVLNFPLIVFAQQTYEIKFDDGSTKQVRFDYDDPDNLPRFNFTFNALGFSVIGNGMLSYKLIPEFRINSKMMVTASWSSAYSRGLDDNIVYNSPYIGLYKKTSAFNLLFHYTFFTIDKPKEKKVSVDYGGNTVYIARLPRIIAKSFQLEAGINRMMTPANLALRTDSSTAFNTFTAMNFSSVNGVAGVSYYKHESYQVTSNGISRSYFRYTRIYAHVLVAIKTGYDTYSVTYGSAVTTAPAGSGFVAPEVNKVGWNIGLEKHMGIKNTSLSMCIGVEYGKIPHLTESGGTESENGSSPSEMFQIHFGLGFGTKLQE